MPDINIAIVGVGNCASSLVQGLKYYKDNKKEVIGLIHENLGGYKLSDIKAVVGFDVDKRKVSTKQKTIDISEAIFAAPNNSRKISDVPNLNASVYMGPKLDGVPEHMLKHPKDKTFDPSDEEAVDVVEKLKEHKAEVMINYLPVGSQKATEFYADCAIKAGCAFINCMPTLIACEESWQKRFEEAGLPVLGDDIKSQLGATYTHRALIQAFLDRGVKIISTTQGNYAGNTDLLNLSDKQRNVSKIVTKKSSIKSLIPYELEGQFYAGPGDPEKQYGYVDGKGDEKTAPIKIHGIGFGGVRVDVDATLTVDDSPNSAGVIIDLVRCAKLAMDRKIAGVIESPSSFFFKCPPVKLKDLEAKKRTEEFIEGNRER